MQVNRSVHVGANSPRTPAAWPAYGYATCKEKRLMAMDRDEIEAAVSLLLDDMEGEWGDRHEIYLRIRQTLDQMRAMGMPLPGRSGAA